MSQRALSEASHRATTAPATARAARPRASGRRASGPTRWTIAASTPAATAPPSTAATRAAGVDDRRNRTNTITAVAPSAQNAGMRWHSPVSASSTAAVAR